MLTDKQIELAKKKTVYSERGAVHEHPDCVRMAYEWLDAQKKIKGTISRTLPLKHIIERWGGRYISAADVEVAAQMHPEIRGAYPHYNISARLTEPSKSRLEIIGEAFTQGYHDRRDPKGYSRSE